MSRGFCKFSAWHSTRESRVNIPTAIWLFFKTCYRANLHARLRAKFIARKWDLISRTTQQIFKLFFSYGLFGHWKSSMVFRDPVLTFPFGFTRSGILSQELHNRLLNLKSLRKILTQDKNCPKLCLRCRVNYLNSVKKAYFHKHNWKKVILKNVEFLHFGPLSADV